MLLLVAGVAAAVVLTGDDGAATTAPSTSQPGEAGATVATRIGDLPPTPAPPRVSAASGYRSVTFAVTAPRYRGSADVSLEADIGHGWDPIGPTITMETEMGGERTCARFRSLATADDGTRSTSRAVRRCGRAAGQRPAGRR